MAAQRICHAIRCAIDGFIRVAFSCGDANARASSDGDSHATDDGLSIDGR
jgi:hypothetical protein